MELTTLQAAPARRRIRVVSRSRRRRRAGQTTIEFAFVVVLLLMALMATVGAAFWAQGSMDIVSAAESAARLATGVSSVGHPAGTPDIAAVQNIRQQLQVGLVGTHIGVIHPVPGPSGSESDPCPAATYPPGTINVCAGYTADGTNTGSYAVIVQISGCIATNVPLVFLHVGKCQSGIPVDQVAVLHGLNFQQ